MDLNCSGPLIGIFFLFKSWRQKLHIYLQLSTPVFIRPNGRQLTCCPPRTHDSPVRPVEVVSRSQGPKTELHCRLPPVADRVVYTQGWWTGCWAEARHVPESRMVLHREPICPSSLLPSPPRMELRGCAGCYWPGATPTNHGLHASHSWVAAIAGQWGSCTAVVASCPAGSWLCQSPQAAKYHIHHGTRPTAASSLAWPAFTQVFSVNVPRGLWMHFLFLMSFLIFSFL